MTNILFDTDQEKSFPPIWNEAFIKVLSEMGYGFQISKMKAEGLEVGVFFERNRLKAGIDFGIAHRNDVIISSFFSAVGASMYGARVVVLPHHPILPWYLYRIDNLMSELKGIEFESVYKRRLHILEGLYNFAKAFFTSKNSIVICYNEKQKELLEDLNAKKVILPPWLYVSGNSIDKVEKKYDVLINANPFKIPLNVLNILFEKFAKLKLNVLFKFYMGEAKGVKALAEKYGFSTISYISDFHEYLKLISSAKIQLSASIVDENLGFRFFDSIVAGTPVVSITSEWLSFIPRLNSFDELVSLDWEELLAKQQEQAKTYTFDKFVESLKKSEIPNFLEKGGGLSNLLY